MKLGELGHLSYSTLVRPGGDRDAMPHSLRREWRTHFHVPVFLDNLGGVFGTTRFALEAALKMHKQQPLSRQLEIETPRSICTRVS